MSRFQEIAELLVASWVLSHEKSAEPLPPADVLDRALQNVTEDGAFPDWLRSSLHFVDSRVGLRCVELESVLNAAQRAEFTSDPNPSYSATDLKIGPRAARALLRRHKEVTVEMARDWGTRLQLAINHAASTRQHFPAEL